MRKRPNPTHAQALVTLRTGKELPVLLHELYVDQHLSHAAIAAELGVTRLTVAMWLRQHQIERPESVA